jgi:hypothetical protein
VLKGVFRTSEPWAQNRGGPEEREWKGLKEKGYIFFESTSKKRIEIQIEIQTLKSDAPVCNIKLIGLIYFILENKQ